MPHFIYGPTVSSVPFVTQDDVVIYYPQGNFVMRGPFYMPRNKTIFPIVDGWTMGEGGGQLGDIAFGELPPAGKESVIFPEVIAKIIAETNLQALRVFSSMNKNKLSSVQEKESAEDIKNISENTAKLADAAAKGSLEKIINLLSSYSVKDMAKEINKPCTEGGATPLHQACAHGRWHVIILLLILHADIDKPTLKGTTPGQLLKKHPLAYAEVMKHIAFYPKATKLKLENISANTSLGGAIASTAAATALMDTSSDGKDRKEGERLASSSSSATAAASSKDETPKNAENISGATTGGSILSKFDAEKSASKPQPPISLQSAVQSTMSPKN